MEASSPLEQLVPALRIGSDQPPEVLRGVLESVFMAAFKSTAKARDMAELIVVEADYDTAASLLNLRRKASGS